MSRTGENIYRRRDGRWEGRYIAGRNPLSGKIQYGYLYGKTYEEVRVRRQQKAEECERGTDGDTKRSSGTTWESESGAERRGRNRKTVEACLSRWLKGKETEALHTSTLQLYRRQIQTHILPVLGRCRVEHLTGDVLEEFEREKRENGRLDGAGGLSDAAVTGLMGILYGMLQEAWEEGDIREVPHRKPKKRPKKACHTEQAFSEEEQIQIEKTLSRLLRGERGRGIHMGILFAIYTGLRVGELAGLQWKDLDLKAATVSVSRTLQRVAAPEGNEKKTVLQVGPPKSHSSNRTFPIKEEMNLILKQYKKSLPREAAQPEAPVFGNDKGGYAEPRLFQKYFANVLRKAGVEKRKFHALRHTFATRCIERNMDIQSLSECLGHSSGKMTLQVYAHSFTEHKRRCMRNLGFLWNLTQIEKATASLRERDQAEKSGAA